MTTNMVLKGYSKNNTRFLPPSTTHHPHAFRTIREKSLLIIYSLSYFLFLFRISFIHYKLLGISSLYLTLFNDNIYTSAGYCVMTQLLFFPLYPEKDVPYFYVYHCPHKLLLLCMLSNGIKFVGRVDQCYAGCERGCVVEESKNQFQ